jgi:rsbT antagonist protein RsbS
VGASIVKQGSVLVATLESEPADAELLAFQRDLVERVGATRVRGVVLDVTAVEVLDSFATRTLREVAHSVRLRGARAVVVGIQPDVAFAMVQLGLSLDETATALDVENGLGLLAQSIEDVP